MILFLGIKSLNVPPYILAKFHLNIKLIFKLILKFCVLRPRGKYAPDLIRENVF